MSKHRVVVLKIIAGQLSVAAAAAEYGMSRPYLHKLVARYRADGLDGLEPRSRAPKSSPQAVTDRVRDRVVQLRVALTAAGTDAGPVTIAWHLTREGLHAPSTSTIRRILHAAGLITPEPRKRPRSSYVRFEASQPNETWQSDFAANASSSSPTTTPPPSSTSTPAKSSQPTPSTPPEPTGETKNGSPADGRTPVPDVSYVATQMSPMSRLITGWS
ncbi:MAG: helix-turn-helix domain-containing protein [Demequina sp.]|uniref:helix-turn-helix domain-containing protein n=1 Tax=Demequina sp. TaxID=2050685 RepID=UPI003A85FFE5